MSAVSTRRTLFAGAGAVVVGSSGMTAGAATAAGAVPPVHEHPDAELIALCINGEAIDDRSAALIDETDDMFPSDPRWSPAVNESRRIFGQCREIMNRAATVQARTADGLRAKASLALREIGSSDFDDCPLILSVLTQLAGRA